MKAFTLIETLVAIFIFVILMISLSFFIFNFYRLHSYSWQQSLAISEAKRGIEKMVKEIREAREGENGAYPIEYAGDKEIIFYSDIDNDGKAERVRYFLGKIETKNISRECETSIRGGACSVSFSDFLEGNLISANLKVSVDGDLGSQTEYVEVFANGQKLDNLCTTGCVDCLGFWQGTKTFNVLNFAQQNSISLLADASNQVDPSCPFAMKAKFELSILQEVQTSELKKGVIKATGTPPTYPPEEEKISIITSYVRNAPPIFQYFDERGQLISDYPSRLLNTKVIKVFLVVNVDPSRPPNDYQLQSFVQLRNLKKQ
jgi:hypothetical protein